MTYNKGDFVEFTSPDGENLTGQVAGEFEDQIIVRVNEEDLALVPMDWIRVTGQGPFFRHANHINWTAWRMLN